MISVKDAADAAVVGRNSPGRTRRYLDARATAHPRPAFAARVRKAGAHFEQHDYAGSGHLFIDPDRPGYDAGASEQMFARVCDFLDRLAHVGA